MGADAVVIRHGASGAPHTLAHSGWIEGSVVNAGDGTHEHPTQALLDAFTMRRHLGELEGRRIMIVGDVLHSRVARSNVLLLSTLGAKVTVVAPPTLLPVGVDRGRARSPTTWTTHSQAADAVMMLRVQRERMNAAFFPSAREYSPALRPRRCSAWRSCRRALDRDAPRPDEPGPGDLCRGGRPSRAR